MAARQTIVGLCAVVVMLGARAGGAAAPPPGTVLLPAPPSALVTRRDLVFVLARWQDDVVTTTLLALRQPGAEPRPVARLQQWRQDSELQVSVQRLHTRSDSADAADIEMAALEHLYGLVFRLQPLASFCLNERRDEGGNEGLIEGLIEGAGICDVTQGRLSHAGMLQALAALRAQAASRVVSAQGTAKPVPWRVVHMRDAAQRLGDVDTVSVRAIEPDGPIHRLAVHFDRAPHSICTTRTDADGVATCRLEDQHGDGGQHDHATAVVATFPGELRPDRVLLPTTAVLAITLGAAMPGFARPPSLPFGLPPLAPPDSLPSAPTPPAAFRP